MSATVPEREQTTGEIVAVATADITPVPPHESHNPPAATEAAVAALPADMATTDSAATGPLAGRHTGGQVMASLDEAFAAHFYYPPLARRKGWEGEVTLALRVEIDGRLTGIHVVGSSGYRVLDNAAVDSLVRARALPLPGGTLGDSLDMLLPVQYRLLDARG